MFFYSNHIFRVYVCLHCSNKLFSVAVNEVIISLTFRLNHFNRSVTVQEYHQIGPMQFQFCVELAACKVQW